MMKQKSHVRNIRQVSALRRHLHVYAWYYMACRFCGILSSSKLCQPSCLWDVLSWTPNFFGDKSCRSKEAKTQGTMSRFECRYKDVSSLTSPAILTCIDLIQIQDSWNWFPCCSWYEMVGGISSLYQEYDSHTIRCHKTLTSKPLLAVASSEGGVSLLEWDDTEVCMLKILQPI